MKKLLLVFLMIFIRINAQTNTVDSISTSKDSVNIRQLLQEQINKVQENQNKTSNKPVEINADWGTSNKEDLNAGTKDILSPGLKYKFASIILAMIISGFYLILKKEKIIKKNKSRFLKENISSVRAEKPIRREKNELSIIRTNLKKNAVFLSPHEREISKSAKELKIAKGELYLAAELKSLELTKIGNNKIKMV